MNHRSHQGTCTKLKNLDAFGADIEFYYKGRNKYYTVWGCVVTAFVALAYLIMVGLKCTEFFGETDGIEQFS